MGIVATEPSTSNEKTAHTPGPWRVCGGYTPAFKAIVGPDDVLIVQAFSVDRDCEVQAANARLIAAAPELLEACRDMLEKIHRLYPLDWQGTKGMARAAIAKAEGK